MRLTGSFHTMTIHGVSGRTSSFPNSSSTVSGMTISSVPVSLMFVRGRRGVCGLARPDIGGNPREQAVHEPARIFRRILLGKLDGFGDHDCGRHLRLPAELERAEPEQGPVDHGHAF